DRRHVDADLSRVHERGERQGDGPAVRLRTPGCRSGGDGGGRRRPQRRLDDRVGRARHSDRGLAAGSPGGGGPHHPRPGPWWNQAARRPVGRIMSTLLLMHAHPADEALATGGAMMKARADGHRVVLVTATRGEVGEIYNMDEKTTRPHLGEVRTKELATAARILDVSRSEILGYRDSGMVGTEDNENPKSFHQAPLAEAAARLAVILREE